MSDELGNHSGLYFPPRVVDAIGRRVRPGCVVTTQFDALTVEAQVQGWSEDGLILLSLDRQHEDSPLLFVAHPSVVEKIDAEPDEAILSDDFFVEVGGPSSVLIVSVGTRDLILRRGADGKRQDCILPDLFDIVFTDASSTHSRVGIREWSFAVKSALLAMSEEERHNVIRRELHAPILQRVIQESVLPRTLERIVLVATDQRVPHPQDTVHTAEILKMWLEANHHVVGIGVPQMERRWFKEVLIESVTALPHVVESVAHFCQLRMGTWAAGADRLVVVHGGGTPAMKMGVLVAASQSRRHIVRHVQVPAPNPRTGQNQSLIEMDLDDMPELGDALGR